MMESLADQVIFSTVRIEGQQKNGDPITGTGFFYDFLREESSSIPCIVTNKHVIDNLITCTLCISTVTKGSSIPEPGEFEKYQLKDCSKQWFRHPQEDLAILPFASIKRDALSRNINLFYRAFNNSLLPSKSSIQNLSAIEDIIMIGYPKGLWDDVNNLPLTRKGITATPFYKDYKGKKEFIVDITCLPGSSGSPIILLNEGAYPTKDGGIAIGRRFFLLGILSKGFTYTDYHQIVSTIPINIPLLSETHTRMDLGRCIKSSCIEDFTEMEILSKKEINPESIKK